MANNDTSFGQSSLIGSGYPTNYLGSIIQSPEIDSSGEPTQRSIKDVGMARDIVKTVIMAGRNRSIVNSRILAKYNAERPYDAYKLEAEGLGWRSNFTTKPLPQMIEKVAPRFTQAVDGVKYLTNSTLPTKYANSTEKSEKFQDGITRLIRARKGWSSLVENIAFNNALWGHTIAAWLDSNTWFPRNFEQDASFVADGTKSNPLYAQIVVLKETLLPHELFDHIKEDLDAARVAGWNIQNTIDAINRASPTQIRDRLNVGGTLETWYQNALRELTIGASYMAGASVVVIYNLLVREVSGKVSHYRMAGPEMLSIYEREDQYPCFCDACAFFTFQKGNDTLHGSKGVGRDIYELAGMVDRTRNEIVDRLIMSGKTMFQGDIKRINTFKMNVIGNSVIVPNGWTFIERKMDGNVEPFLKLDAYFSQIVDQLIGSVSPPQMEGEAFRSPQAWALMAQRQEEGKDVRISRFLQQFTDLVGGMQRRICDPDVIDEDAKTFQKEMLEIMSREELDAISNQPVASTVIDLTPMERQLTVTVANEKKGNPLYNQRALEVADLTARLGKDFAEQVLLPDQDPTEQAEQQRMQNLEIILLTGGQAVPVSPRDNHVIHMTVLMPSMEQLAAHIQEGKFTTDVLQVYGAHLNEHFEQAKRMGVKDPIMPAVEAFLKKFVQAIDKLKQLDQQAATLSAQSSDLEEAHMQDGSGVEPPPMGGAPPGAPPPQ